MPNWERHRCSWCGEWEEGNWVPLPPYEYDPAFPMLVVNYDTVQLEAFIGWPCLDRTGSPIGRAAMIADICQRPVHTVTVRTPEERRSHDALVR